MAGLRLSRNDKLGRFGRGVAAKSLLILLDEGATIGGNQPAPFASGSVWVLSD